MNVDIFVVEMHGGFGAVYSPGGKYSARDVTRRYGVKVLHHVYSTDSKGIEVTDAIIKEANRNKRFNPDVLEQRLRNSR